jgi:hypothetical protein
MKAILVLAGAVVWSLTCLAANPPLDVNTLSSVMDKVMAKQEKKPVACVCQDGSGQAGLVKTTNPAPGTYVQNCLFFISQPGGLPPIPATCAQFTYIPK